MMEGAEFGNGFTERDVKVTFDLKSLFDQKDFGIEAEIFVTLAETIPGFMAGFETRDNIVVRRRNMFEEKTTERAIVVIPDPVGIGVGAFVRTSERSIQPRSEPLSKGEKRCTMGPFSPVSLPDIKDEVRGPTGIG
jgi:hypothetical protein